MKPCSVIASGEKINFEKTTFGKIACFAIRKHILSINCPQTSHDWANQYLVGFFSDTSRGASNFCQECRDKILVEN